MVFFEFMLGVVIITTIASIINNYLKFKLTSRDALDGLDERLNKLEDLEDRIKTLEKIITDQNYDLEQKINSL